jgi:hypothetical protein
LSIATPRNASLIDTLSAGYRALHRRPLALAIPAALSAYLWLGAPVALGAVGVDMRMALMELSRSLGGGAELAREWSRQLLTGDVRLDLAWLNVVPVLRLTDGSAAGAIELRGPAQVAAGAVVINLLALLLSSLYLTLLSEGVRGEGVGHAETLRRTGRAARDILLALLALAGVGLILALPFLAISAILVVTVPGSALLVLLLWYVALFWGYIYTGFTPEAVCMSGAGPLRAIYNSVHVVRRDMGGALGLLLLSLVIGGGLGVLWRQLAATPPGLALAILGSAYVGSGLAAARLEFYRERQARRAGARMR